MLHNTFDQSGPVDLPATLKIKGGCCLLNLLRKFCLIHIDTHTADKILDVIRLHRKLRQDTHSLFLMDHNIVGPLDLCGKSRNICDTLGTSGAPVR